MKRKIIIVPKVLETYKDQYEYSIEIKLLKFIKYIDPSFLIEIFDANKNYSKNNIFIFSGGNSIMKFSKLKKDLIRNKIDQLAYKKAVGVKAKMIGICHGAHFLANRNLASFKINSKHSNTTHKITIGKNERVVNSYHNIIIKHAGKKNKILAFSEDNSVELFENKEMNYLGMIWHPERNKKFNIKDKKIIKKFLCN